MIKIKRTQHLVTDDFTTRIHVLPKDVNAFVKDFQRDYDGPRGKGNVNVPTVPDVCEALIRGGLHLVKEMIVVPTFREYAISEGTQTPIKIEKELEMLLNELQDDIRSEMYAVTDGKIPNLSSIATELMVQCVMVEKQINQ